jgi:hypothetical protein
MSMKASPLCGKTGEVKFLKGTGSARVQHEDGSDAFIHYTRVLAVVDSHQPDERGYDPDADEWLFPSYYDGDAPRRTNTDICTIAETGRKAGGL